MTQAYSWFDWNRGVVSVIGDSTYFDLFLQANRLLQSKGWLVFMPGEFRYGYHRYHPPINNPLNKQSEQEHTLMKIALSQAVVTIGIDPGDRSYDIYLDFARDVLGIPVFDFDSEDFGSDDLAPDIREERYELAAKMADKFIRDRLGF
jgi:hypothetical protein